MMYTCIDVLMYSILKWIWMCHFFAIFWRLAYVMISVALVHIRAALMPHWEVLRRAVHDVLGCTNVFRLCLNVYLCRCNQCVNSDYIQMYWCDDLENITNYCPQCLVLKWIILLNYTTKSGLTGDMWLANTILMKLIWCKVYRTNWNASMNESDQPHFRYFLDMHTQNWRHD